MNYTKTAYGFYVYTGDSEDSVIQRELREKNVWDAPLSKWMSKSLQPGWTCLDIGANNGYFTEHMARLVGPEGKVFGFEASSRMVELYEKGKVLNDYSSAAKITMANTCLSDEVSTKTLFTPEKNRGGASVERGFIDSSGFKERYGFEDESASEVNCVPLSLIFNETPDYIKLDVEGHEENVVRGFSDATRKCPLLTIEFTPFIKDSFFDYLVDTYDLYTLSEKPLSADDLISHRVSWDPSATDLVLRLK